MNPTGKPVKKKLLFLVHRLPYPPNKGDKIASFNLLRFLSERYEVYVGTFVDDPEDRQHTAKVREYCSELCAPEIDPRLRDDVRAELRRLHAELGVTTLYDALRVGSSAAPQRDGGLRAYARANACSLWRAAAASGLEPRRAWSRQHADLVRKRLRRGATSSPVCRCAGCRPATGCYSSVGTGASKLRTRFW